ncbi:unnamed protein product [Jaminaea pallidilutea]
MSAHSEVNTGASLDHQGTVSHEQPVSNEQLSENGDSSSDDSGSTPPTQAELMRELVITLYDRMSRQVTAHVLRRLRNDLVGLSRIRSLISQGYTPQEIGKRLVEPASLAAAVQIQLTNTVQALSLGATLLQTFQYWSSAQQKKNGESLSPAADANGTDSDHEQDCLKVLTTTLRRLHAEPPPPSYDPTLEQIDYMPLHEYVEQEQRSGCLVDDPAWEKTSSRPKNHWDAILARSISSLNTSFNDACSCLNVDSLASGLRQLLLEVSCEAVLEVVLAQGQNPAAMGHLTAGPAPVKSTTGIEGKPITPSLYIHDEDAIIEQGIKAKRQLIEPLLASVTAGKSARLRVDIHRLLLDVVGTRGDWSLKRGQDLLELERYDEAISEFSTCISASGLLPPAELVVGPDTHEYDWLIGFLTKDEEDLPPTTQLGRRPQTKDERRALRAQIKEALLSRARAREAIMQQLSDRSAQQPAPPSAATDLRESATAPVPVNTAEEEESATASITGTTEKLEGQSKATESTLQPVDLASLIKTDYAAVLQLDASNQRAMAGVAEMERVMAKVSLGGRDTREAAMAAAADDARKEDAKQL